jgi:putative ABC transport system permease protein
MNRLLDLLLDTVRSVRAHALRFALTSLGIVWGIFTMTFLQSMTDGFDSHYQSQLQKIGARLIVLFPGVVTKERVGQRDGRSIEIELPDLERLERSARITGTTPNLRVGPSILRAGRRTKLIATYGVSHRAMDMRNFEVRDGRFLSPEDVRSQRRVLFLGYEAARRLFGERTVVGETVHIESIPFQVIGVSRPKGDQMVNFGPNDDELALIPVTTAQRWFRQGKSVDDVFVQVSDPYASNETVAIARMLLSRHHDFAHDSDTAVGAFALEEVLDLVRLLGLGLSIFFGVTGLVTLAVGGVGVMNIMLVVVGERRKEIGLRKALGAPNAVIFLQFLAESVLVTAVAGALGALLGAGLVAAAAAAIPIDPLTGVPVASPPHLFPGTLVMITLVMVGTGIAAGLFPALRAMQVEPAIALREL